MLDKKDEKTIEKIVEKVSVKVVGTALEEIVLPRLQKIDERLEKHGERFKKIDERFNNIDASLNRIETLAKSEIKYVDDLSKRVVKLETKSV